MFWLFDASILCGSSGSCGSSYNICLSELARLRKALLRSAGDHYFHRKNKRRSVYNQISRRRGWMKTISGWPPGLYQHQHRLLYGPTGSYVAPPAPIFTAIRWRVQHFVRMLNFFRRFSYRRIFSSKIFCSGSYLVTQHHSVQTSISLNQ